MTDNSTDNSTSKNTTDNLLTLFCVVDGETTPFSVKISSAGTVDDLKNHIKAKKTPEFDDIAADKLTLWRVSIPVVPSNKRKPIVLTEIDSATELDPTDDISNVFEETLPKKTVHIIVQRPPPDSRPDSPLSGDLRADIKRVTDKFFAPGSDASVFLDAYVGGQQALPVTTAGVCGLPRAWRRGQPPAPESRPNFLFLNLPTAPTCSTTRERFKSNVIMNELDRTNSQDVPVFGVSGCGKTRSVIEMLCLQWGFYFNASDADLGSDDLGKLAGSIGEKTLEDQGASFNTIFARHMTLLLFLSRLLILNYCLRVPNCRQTFSSASWAILQVCPNMFKDVFLELFSELFKLHSQKIDGLFLKSVVREELLSVRDRLTTHDYPNFSRSSKLRLVVDEAQILGDRGSTLFKSSHAQSDPRPMLSPVLHGFRGAGDRGELTVIYCGTGLSVRTLYSALNASAGDGVKELDSRTFPHLEFAGWPNRDSVQSFIDRIKELLPDDESKQVVDTLIPPAAVDMLHQRLTGRFRPIVTAIEKIIGTGDPTKWESRIDDTETMIISWKERERRGNLCGELDRLENKIAKHPEQFASCSSIRETLGLFLYRANLLGVTEFMLEDESQLVEAAFGRIKILGGAARTILDEPFVLKATKNYFWQKDPLFIAAAERAMLHSDNASVHGCMWEAMMPPVFIQTFKNRPFSNWPLLTKDTLPELLSGDVTIVGYNEQEPKLAITYRDISTQEFMKAHVKDNSKQEEKDIPPFYFPSPQVSGPDIIFFVQINANIIPVFVQLKLRQVLPRNDAEQALATVSGHAVQNKLNKEQEKQQKEQEKQQKKLKQQQTTIGAESEKQQPPPLQDYCPTGVYISMVIAYPAEIVSFQAPRPDPKPELDGLQRVSIDVDDSNFAKIFPDRHVKFLDRLKKFKRKAEDQEDQNRSKKAKACCDVCDVNAVAQFSR